MVKVKEDLTNKIFGRLKVLKQSDDYVNPSGRHYAQWLCECDCKDHNQIIVRGADLKNGSTKSCGCISRERVKKYNNYIKKSDEYGVYYIGLTLNTNQEFYVDAQDYNLIKDYCWCEIIHKNYHSLEAWNPNDKSSVVMTHLIMGKYYDHIDRNPLNNRRYNLREYASSQNHMNSSMSSNNTSGVTGVHFDKRINMWIARINDKPNHRIIVYKGTSKQEAIIARLKAELLYYKEFAPQQHLFEQYGVITNQND
jgi:hypothetical protein